MVFLYALLLKTGKVIKKRWGLYTPFTYGGGIAEPAEGEGGDGLGARRQCARLHHQRQLGTRGI